MSASDDLELFASNSIRVLSRERHSGVRVGWPLKNRVGTSRRGIAQTYGRWQKKRVQAVASGTRATLELAYLQFVTDYIEGIFPEPNKSIPHVFEILAFKVLTTTSACR